MNNFLRSVTNSITKTYRKALSIKYDFVKHAHGGENAGNDTSEELLRNILKQRFPTANEITVKDVSGGCGAMYTVYIECSSFKGVPIVKQHKAVYEALDKQIKVIHGLRVETKAPP
ncbi:hypothetical protein PPYR_05500 [Photinus pyralis]|uniref:BolA-like protein 3 n=1 Tax=Photinus pyralis TaxID=7054 RepID=A0A1Y1JUI4_PHOPY|nr:hypothetical protein PPYR_05500 [Photinus pyralis]